MSLGNAGIILDYFPFWQENTQLTISEYSDDCQPEEINLYGFGWLIDD